MSAQDEGLLRMHTDNLFGGIPFDYSQIKRHSGNVERVTGSGNFTGQRRICFRLDQCARIEDYGGAEHH